MALLPFEGGENWQAWTDGYLRRKEKSAGNYWEDISIFSETVRNNCYEADSHPSSRIEKKLCGRRGCSTSELTWFEAKYQSLK